MDRIDEIRAVYQLGEKIGYGNIMDIASALWTLKLSDDGIIRTGHLPTVEPYMTIEGKAVALHNLDARIQEFKTMGII